MLKRLLSWFTLKLLPAPTKYAYVECFGHLCLGVCEVREVRRYGKTFCEASKLNSDGTPGERALIGGGAIYRQTELTKEEALDRARPDWTPYRKQESGPVCGQCGEPTYDCHCDPVPVDSLPIPLDAIDAILAYHTPSLGSQIEPHIEKLRSWYEQEQSDIPF